MPTRKLSEEGAEFRTPATVPIDDEFRSFINSVIAAMAFVPPIFVRVAWRGLNGAAPAFNNRDAYFEGTWIDGNYPLRMWNVYALDGPHTNNHTEGWHSEDSKAGW